MFFWQEVVATYSDNKSNTKLEQVNHTNFKTHHLFSKNLVIYKRKVLFFPSWRNKGIETIKDVIHLDEKRLLSLVEIRALRGQNSAKVIFEYNALVNAIPKQWFEWLRGEINDVYIRPPCEAMLYNVKPNQVKKILMTNKQNTVPTACSFWQKNVWFYLKGICMAHSLENNKRKRDKECYNGHFCIIYIQQIFCLKNGCKRKR